MRLQVKICGITNLEDALAAVDVGADLLGFVLYSKSPRFVDPGQVQTIVTALRSRGHHGAALPRMVGVFVNEPAARVQAVLDATGLDLAQLHGDEAPESVAALQGRAYKALRPMGLVDARAWAQRYWPFGTPDGPRLLVDAYDPHIYGGTGQKADWSAAATLARDYPGVLLAGGLTPENAAAATSQVKPWGLDVSSGVEAVPGRKDHDRLLAFMAAIRIPSRNLPLYT